MYAKVPEHLYVLNCPVVTNRLSRNSPKSAFVQQSALFCMRVCVRACVRAFAYVRIFRAFLYSRAIYCVYQ